MSGVQALRALRKASAKGEAINLYSSDGDVTDSIKEASQVSFGNHSETKYDLDLQTNFYNEDKPQDLRSVVFCWLYEKHTDQEYKAKANELGFVPFSIVCKFDLLTWLKGSIDSCQFVKEEKSSNKSVDTIKDIKSEPETRKHKLDDPQLQRISAFERESIDHNAALRGSKNIDFSYLISDAKKFMRELKRAKTAPKKSQNSNSSKKQPIIIVSPATTALLALSNIKQFLENGEYTVPVTSNRPQSGVVILNHPSDKLIPQGQKIMVVDNTDLFTNPDYWNRVIAIFTTGQTWQFSKYKYNKAELLFQKYQGFYVGYQGESTPSQIKDWNVREIKVNKGDQRFKDKVIVKDLWLDLEKILISKGYGK
ncbi:CDC73 [Candida pseudojiufengensis]|uniref:CDC73 n=1 Tax=Candida pseudojiufengensis TaxID=497109 RepID=UPI0022243D8E|nr:CDC73 [Candida pseudojiufengensis]KAI5966481.1 CDC73 [Candida pseudojiufengensis]